MNIEKAQEWMTRADKYLKVARTWLILMVIFLAMQFVFPLGKHPIIYTASIVLVWTSFIINMHYIIKARTFGSKASGYLEAIQDDLRNKIV